MPRIKVIRATVIQGRARIPGEVLDVTPTDLMYLGRRVEIITDEPVASAPEPEHTIATVAENASLVAQGRTRRRV